MPISNFLWRSCIKPEIGEHRKILRYVYLFTRTIFAFKVNSTILGLLGGTLITT